MGRQEALTRLRHIEISVLIEVWQKALAKHPDQQFARYIIKGLTGGFWVGFNHTQTRLQQASRNMPCSNQQIVSDYLQGELEADLSNSRRGILS